MQNSIVELYSTWNVGKWKPKTEFKQQTTIDYFLIDFKGAFPQKWRYLKLIFLMKLRNAENIFVVFFIVSEIFQSKVCNFVKKVLL